MKAVREIQTAFGLTVFVLFSAAGVSTVVFAGAAGFYAARALFG